VLNFSQKCENFGGKSILLVATLERPKWLLSLLFSGYYFLSYLAVAYLKLNYWYFYPSGSWIQSWTHNHINYSLCYLRKFQLYICLSHLFRGNKVRDEIQIKDGLLKINFA